MKRLIFLLLLTLPSKILASHNIVLIVADDLDSELDGMTPLPMTRSLIGAQGATYTNCVNSNVTKMHTAQQLASGKINHALFQFVASPICCPNRASILTGKYQHNHKTVNNSMEGGCSSQEWQRTQEKYTFASILKREMSYKTFYAGKYLNQYGTRAAGGVSYFPPGWDSWAGLVGNSKYYNYSLSVNGKERKYGDNPDTDYLTDVIGKLAVPFINSQKNSDKPFLMVLSPPAPHAPFIPASRHSGKYKDVKAKKTPSFDIAGQTDKHWLVRMGPSPLPESTLTLLDDTYRRRWETLAAVDEMVSKVHKALADNDLLSKTYVIFTSDNGYHIGQFSMPIDKRQPYETDIKVPLLVMGPGISPSNITAPVSSVDLFATILGIAGIEHPSDGTTILTPHLPADRTVLVEYRGERSEIPDTSGCPTDSDMNLSHCSKDIACKCEDSRNNTYACVRRVSDKHNNIFCVFEDDEKFVEAYDFHEDQYQLHNIGYSMKSHYKNRFRKRLKEMVQCEGAECIRIGQNT